MLYKSSVWHGYMKNIIKSILSIAIITLFLSTTVAPAITAYSSKTIDPQENRLISPNSENIWQQINEDGFGSNENVGPRGIEIFNGSLITATANYNNESKIELGQTYDFNEFFDIYNSMGRFENGLYSNGLEIWSYNGTNWTQLVGSCPEAIMSAGFGNKNNSELGFLKVFKGHLYAGVRNRFEGAQVWRTNSINISWEKVAEGGFGCKNNTAAWTAEEFNGYLYVGTINWCWDGENGGCEMYRTKDGENWTAVVGGNSSIPPGFMMPRQMGMNFYLWSMANYSGYLYVGTSFPGDIWRTNDGINWEPFVAYDTMIEAKLHGAKYPRHFGRFYVGGIRRMQVYKDELYIFSAQDYGKMRVIIEGYGNFISKITSLIKLPRIRHNSLKYYLAGTQIWKYNSTTDRWVRVVGKFGHKSTSGGFGDLQNTYLWSVEADEDYLYVGTMHPDSTDITLTRNGFKDWSICIERTKGHGQLWRYNGETWDCIVGKGKGLEFDDEYNVGMREMKIYNNNLIMGTMNANTGCEVWKYSLSTE